MEILELWAMKMVKFKNSTYKVVSIEVYSLQTTMIAVIKKKFQD